MADYPQRIPHIKQVKPRRRSNRKALFLLFLFFLILLAVVFFRSPLSKVEAIHVFGNDIYTKEDIVKASGLTLGMQFLNVWERQVRERLAHLRGIDEVVVTRDFPGVIQLHVKEYQRLALYTTVTGERYPLLENGVLLTEVPFQERIVDRPLIRTWGDQELLDELGVALSKLSPAILAEISDIALTPTAYDKQRITLYMKDGNEVQSVITQLARKMPYYPAIVKEIPRGEKGVVYLLESAWFRKYERSGTGTPPAADTDQLDGSRQGNSRGSGQESGQEGNSPMPQAPGRSS